MLPRADLSALNKGVMVFSTSEILDLAIRIEENGEHFYRQAMDKTTDPFLMAILGSVADEEVRHREWFIKTKQSMGRRALDMLPMKMSGFFMQDAIDDRGFSLEEVDLASLPDEESILRVAIGFEEDSITFYEIIGGFIEDEDTLKNLMTIIDEEKRHIRLLEDRIDFMSRKDALLPLAEK